MIVKLQLNIKRAPVKRMRFFLLFLQLKWFFLSFDFLLGNCKNGRKNNE